MFIGHFAVGMGAKSLQPKISLGTFFIAAQFLDLLWPTFLLLGWETVSIEPGNTTLTPLNFTSYPYTHSLLMALAWSFLLGIVYWFIKKNKQGAFVLGICVLSHWLLDLFVHRPDLPLLPVESSMHGFGLWNHPLTAILLEGLIFVVGIVLYLRTTKAKNKTGLYAFWSLVAFLAIIQVMNMMGPPPPNVTAIAWAGQLQWLFVLWAYWVDRNRENCLKK